MSSNTTLATVQEGGFGSFIYMCRYTGSYPFCNLFYRQLQKARFTLESPVTAPVGIQPICAIPRATNGRFGNIMNTVLCGLSFVFIVYLSQRVSRRRAAVGRVEIRALLVWYAVSLILQAITTSGILKQGTIPLIILTVLHTAVVVSLFWLLLGNALVATQFVEDGTPSSLIPYYGLAAILFLVAAYIATDTSFGFTSIFKSDPPRDLRNIGLFILLVMWPIFTVLLYFGIMSFIVVRTLGEKKPLFWYFLALALFVGSQVAFFLLGTPICQATNRFIDSAFVATFFETAAVGVLFFAWRSITESNWQDMVYLV